jgi:hypothetical protein
MCVIVAMISSTNRNQLLPTFALDRSTQGAPAVARQCCLSRWRWRWHAGIGARRRASASRLVAGLGRSGDAVRNVSSTCHCRASVAPSVVPSWRGAGIWSVGSPRAALSCILAACFRSRGGFLSVTQRMANHKCSLSCM